MCWTLLVSASMMAIASAFSPERASMKQHLARRHQQRQHSFLHQRHVHGVSTRGQAVEFDCRLLDHLDPNPDNNKDTSNSALENVHRIVAQNDAEWYQQFVTNAGLGMEMEVESYHHNNHDDTAAYAHVVRQDHAKENEPKHETEELSSQRRKHSLPKRIHDDDGISRNRSSSISMDGVSTVTATTMTTTATKTNNLTDCSSSSDVKSITKPGRKQRRRRQVYAAATRARSSRSGIKSNSYMESYDSNDESEYDFYDSDDVMSPKRCRHLLDMQEFRDLLDEEAAWRISVYSEFKSMFQIMFKNKAQQTSSPLERERKRRNRPPRTNHEHYANLHQISSNNRTPRESSNRNSPQFQSSRSPMTIKKERAVTTVAGVSSATMYTNEKIKIQQQVSLLEP